MAQRQPYRRRAGASPCGRPDDKAMDVTIDSLNDIGLGTLKRMAA
jgi:hypothetical protein